MREVGDSRTDGVCRPSEARATTSVRDHVLSARVAYTIFPHDVREVRFPTRFLVREVSYSRTKKRVGNRTSRTSCGNSTLRYKCGKVDLRLVWCLHPSEARVERHTRRESLFRTCIVHNFLIRRVGSSILSTRFLPSVWEIELPARSVEKVFIIFKCN